MLYDGDTLLLPYKKILLERQLLTLQKAQLLQGSAPCLADSCNSYLYYGLHYTGQEWVLREWAPHATAIFLLFEGNNWKKHTDYLFTQVENENWELRLPKETLSHGMLYKLLVE